MKPVYTDSAIEALDYACELASNQGSNFVGTEHLLLALAVCEDSAVSRILKDNGVSFDKLSQYLRASKKTKKKLYGEEYYSEKLKAVLTLAKAEAKNLKCMKVGTDHLLLAILKTPDSTALKLLASFSVNIQKIFMDILAANGVDSNAAKKELSQLKAPNKKKSATPALDQYSRDLTLSALNDEMDPVVGRTEEIERVMQILCRRMKNNPCLVGEPGVGKTAVVEGLAQLIAAGNVPELLQDKRILSLDLSGMVAGSKYRGEF